MKEEREREKEERGGRERRGTTEMRGIHIEKRIEFRGGGKRKGQRGGKSQEQPAIITTDPPWYSIELVY